MGREAELIEAARAGNYPQVERILSAKPRKAGPFASLRRAQGGTGSRDSRGYTALHYAALNGHREVVLLLLSYEASCNSVDQAGSSPLHLAAWAGHGEVVRLLLDTGPSIPNVNLTNGDKETALHCAAQYGHMECVKLLLDAGADPNIKNSREETALDHAAQYGRADTVSLLLETNPEMVGKYTAYGNMLYTHTPLHLAARNGHLSVVLQLLQVTYAHCNQKEFSFVNETKEGIRVSLQVGLDINVRTARGTALHEAALCGKVEVVRALVERGINPGLRDQGERTVVEVIAGLQTERTREITRIILSGGDTACLASPASPPASPVRPRTAPLAARSVEELDKRSSFFSVTSGCSDCTTSTLQGARSCESSFLSESEVTMTGGRGGSGTSISSGSSTRSLSPTPRTNAPPLQKPKVPAKPAHIRPGLKPVRIPAVPEDKLGLKPRKPPRRNHSISPVRSRWESEAGEDSSCSTARPPPGQVYSSKAGSKSFDELDDILNEKPRRQSGRRRGRRTLSSISGSDLARARERRAGEGGAGEMCSAAQCGGAGESCPTCTAQARASLTIERSGDCRERYISQAQYKRRIRREGTGGGQQGYSTLDTRTERRLSSQV